MCRDLIAQSLTPLNDVLQAIEEWPRPALRSEEVDLGSAITWVIAEPVITAAPVPPVMPSIHPVFRAAVLT